jgi:hypothetical protein
MGTLNVKTRDGTRLAIEAHPGLSVMENIRNAGIAQETAVMPARHKGYSIL